MKPDARARTKDGAGGRWRLQDAKARFSEVVRRAREQGPQRVTLHGKDAVVIVDAETYDRERERHTGRRPLEPKEESVIPVPGRIDRLLIDQHRVDHAAHLD